MKVVIKEGFKRKREARGREAQGGEARGREAQGEDEKKRKVKMHPIKSVLCSVGCRLGRIGSENLWNGFSIKSESPLISPRLQYNWISEYPLFFINCPKLTFDPYAKSNDKGRHHKKYKFV